MNRFEGATTYLGISTALRPSLCKNRNKVNWDSVAQGCNLCSSFGEHSGILMFLVTWWLRILLCFWYWNRVFAGRYVSHCICIFCRAHVVIQVLRVPESTPPLPKDVKDMIDRRIEIINNKEELVSVLNPVPLADVLLLPGCQNWVNLSLCDRWIGLRLGIGWEIHNLQG